MLEYSINIETMQKFKVHENDFNQKLIMIGYYARFFKNRKGEYFQFRGFVSDDNIPLGFGRLIKISAD